MTNEERRNLEIEYSFLLHELDKSFEIQRTLMDMCQEISSILSDEHKYSSMDIPAWEKMVLTNPTRVKYEVSATNERANRYNWLLERSSQLLDELSKDIVRKTERIDEIKMLLDIDLYRLGLN